MSIPEPVFRLHACNRAENHNRYVYKPFHYNFVFPYICFSIQIQFPYICFPIITISVHKKLLFPLSACSFSEHASPFQPAPSLNFSLFLFC